MADTLEEKAWNLHSYVTTMIEDKEKCIYNVPSSGHSDSYNIIHYQDPDISDNEWTCNCKSFQYRGHTSLNYQCSHIKAVHFALENGIIAQAHSIRNYVMSDTKIGEARLTGELDPKVMESLCSMSEAEAHNTDIVIIMRVPAMDFKLREMSFSCYNRLEGTIVFSPKNTEICHDRYSPFDVQANADHAHETPLPADQMPVPKLPDSDPVPTAENDNSLPF